MEWQQREGINHRLIDIIDIWIVVLTPSNLLPSSLVKSYLPKIFPSCKHGRCWILWQQVFWLIQYGGRFALRSVFFSRRWKGWLVEFAYLSTYQIRSSGKIYQIFSDFGLKESVTFRFCFKSSKFSTTFLVNRFFVPGGWHGPTAASCAGNELRGAFQCRHMAPLRGFVSISVVPTNRLQNLNDSVFPMWMNHLTHLGLWSTVSTWQAIGRILCSGNTLRSSPAAPTQSLCRGSRVKLQDSFLHQMIRIYSTIHPIHLQMDRSAEMHDHEKRRVRFFNLQEFSKKLSTKFKMVQRCLSIAFRCVERPRFLGSSLVPRYVPKEVGALSGTGASPAGMLSRGRNRGIWNSESLLVQLFYLFDSKDGIDLLICHTIHFYLWIRFRALDELRPTSSVEEQSFLPFLAFFWEPFSGKEHRKERIFLAKDGEKSQRWNDSVASTLQRADPIPKVQSTPSTPIVQGHHLESCLLLATPTAMNANSVGVVFFSLWKKDDASETINKSIFCLGCSQIP